MASYLFTEKCGVSMYDSQTALIANYINPIIGDMESERLRPRAVDGYVRPCRKPSRCLQDQKAVNTYVSDKTIEKDHQTPAVCV